MMITLEAKPSCSFMLLAQSQTIHGLLQTSYRIEKYIKTAYARLEKGYICSYQVILIITTIFNYLISRKHRS
jgi:hypothetical protein